jgi:hypothetical protein
MMHARRVPTFFLITLLILVLGAATTFSVGRATGAPPSQPGDPAAVAMAHVRSNASALGLSSTSA